MSETGNLERVVALVPMRHGSERVPGKNHRVLHGKRLCCWIIDALLESGVIDEVLIDTDSGPIREIAEAYGDAVRVIERPRHLVGGMVSMNDVIAHDLEHCEAGTIVQTHSTNPMLRASTIAAAVGVYREHLRQHDSLFGVIRRQARMYSASGDPVNHDPARLGRTQDLEPLFEENSCLYVFSPSSFKGSGARIGRRPLMLEMDSIESVDIDEERDFVLAEELLRAGAADRAAAPVVVGAEPVGTESAA